MGLLFNEGKVFEAAISHERTYYLTHGQSNHISIRAVDTLDHERANALDGITTSLTKRLTCFDVGLDFGITQFLLMGANCPCIARRALLG